ncbi:hypothetical protein [Methylopila sp. M107]|uniref:hypothetical protein n=1 Tax=Methylopila sp. M107 TaxID=1101190 RepID=UPI0012DC799C|nr:hypothetical protein [Methylopila sp. M107]
MLIRNSVLGAAVALGFVAAPSARAEPTVSAPPSSKAASADLVGPRDSAEEIMLFTPIAPCRAFNTAAPVRAGQTRNFTVAGSNAAAFTAQGGPAAGCGIPTHAKAVVVNFSAVSPSSAGYFRAYAFGAPTPSTSVLNYLPGSNATGGATVALGDGNMTVRVGSGAARVVGDITGYFTRQISATIIFNGSISKETSSILASERTGTGLYKLTIDRDITYCAPVATPTPGYTDSTDHIYANAYISDMQFVFVRLWRSNGTTQVPIDSNFQFSVHC